MAETDRSASLPLYGIKKVLLQLVDTRVLILFVAPLVLYIAFSHFMPLIEPDESRYFEIADNMLDSGDYVTPRLSGVIYLEKPPLSYWASAFILHIFGENDFTARLYVGICAWACLLLVYSIGSVLYDRKTGLYASGVLGTTLFFFVFGNFNILDIPLTFYTCSAIWAGYRYLTGTIGNRSWLYLLYLSSALAFLTKGLIGVVFPFAILSLWLAISGQGKRILKLFSLLGIALFLAITCPWLILIQKEHTDFFRFFFIQEHFLRYTTTMHGRDNSVMLYVPVVIAGFVPWTPFLIRAAWEVKKDRGFASNLTGKSFLWTWIVFIFVFFSLSSSKLIPYIAPIFLPLSVLIGDVARNYDELIPRARGRYQSFLLHLPVVIQFLLLAGFLLLPIFLGDGSRLGGDLSIFHSKKWAWLITPPLLSLTMLMILPHMVKRVYRSGWFMAVYLLSAFFLISMLPAASTFLTPYKSAYPASEAIKTMVPVGQEVYQYKICLYGISTYDEIRTPIVGDFGELKYGASFLPPDEREHYFLSVEQFRERVGKGDAAYCLTEYNDNYNELKSAFPNLDILWTNGAYYLLKLTAGEVNR
ncbi:MAG: glycosyltransferase family 39 protein [Syntrophobacterales bacterium]|nr:glycosyltransferase family 39 protein [Syntrophobacterales bacterium]